MPGSGFETFGTSHLWAIAATAAVPAVLILAARRSGSPARPRSIARGLAAMLLINEAAYWTYRISQMGCDGFIRQHLPLHVCGVAVFATAATLLCRKRRAFEICYFWGLAAALNAVITPGNLDASFPEFRFFQYFVAHSGIVTGVLFATWGLGMRPTLSGVWRAFAYLNVLAAGIAGLNWLTGSNYMYLRGPPTGTESPFFFLPWPWYIPVLGIIGLGMFFAIALPFLGRRQPARGGRREAAGGNE